MQCSVDRRSELLLTWMPDYPVDNQPEQPGFFRRHGMILIVAALVATVAAWQLASMYSLVHFTPKDVGRWAWDWIKVLLADVWVVSKWLFVALILWAWAASTLTAILGCHISVDVADEGTALGHGGRGNERRQTYQ